MKRFIMIANGCCFDGDIVTGVYNCSENNKIQKDAIKENMVEENSYSGSPLNYEIFAIDLQKDDDYIFDGDILLEKYKEKQLILENEEYAKYLKLKEKFEK